MTLNVNTGAVPAQQSVDAQIAKASAGDQILTPAQQAEVLAAAYDAYAKGGTLPGCDLTAGGDTSQLEAAFLSDNTPATITRLASGICGYWATCVTPGAPEHGGTAVVSVVINSAAFVPAMSAAITDLVSDPNADGWPSFYEATGVIVKAFPCVIIELVGGIATPFPEVIT